MYGESRFVTVDGVMTDLNPLIPPDSGWLLEYAYGLNERGQIVGAGHRDGVAPIRAFLLSGGSEHSDGEKGNNGEHANGSRR